MAKNVYKRCAVPDRVDLRDRPYLPSVTSAPKARLNSLQGLKVRPPVLDQGKTNACTGFALATVVNCLLKRADEAREAPVSAFMIYSMARRYDEFPGSIADTGSSLRGAMKGWYKHGICAHQLWTEEKMPPPTKDPKKDWWWDAVKRPLGAYYRVDPRSVTDMHAALNDVGILYASAICHRGWDEGIKISTSKRHVWRIPCKERKPDDGGHAFAIVGYDEYGFLVQNSWGKDWGSGGLAFLAYDDWNENAMDCWVAQLGVVTEQHREVASTPSLRTSKTDGVVTVHLATNLELRNHEITPFIINMENNGSLSNSGTFRTDEEDLRALVTIHLPEALKAWKDGSHPIDIAIYAHGGLTDEKTAAETASRWIPALYQQQIFPIFLMWESDLWSTLKNRLEDIITGEPRPTGGFRDEISKWWNERLERTLAKPGTAIWQEMKQNAAAIADDKQSGIRKLHAIWEEKKNAFDPDRVRLHLIGHSAGSIVHSHIVNWLCNQGWRFKTINFMAPAVTMETFKSCVLPPLKSQHIEQYNQFHLTDEMEQKDPTCRPILGYGRSLLYLVSQSLEHGVQTPILGMEKYFRELPLDDGLQKRIRSWATPTNASGSTTHGGFDDDERTMKTVIKAIKSA